MEYKKEDLQLIFSNIEVQHKDIDEAVKNIYEACTKPKDKEVILKLIYTLDKYVTEHFKDEEYLAEIVGFPKLEYLKKDHEYFRAVYYRLRYHYNYYDENAKDYKYICMFAIHLAKTLEEWLKFHLKTLDRELMEYLQENILKN